jgi:hypothetical protein
LEGDEKLVQKKEEGLATKKKGRAWPERRKRLGPNEWCEGLALEQLGQPELVSHPWLEVKLEKRAGRHNYLLTA